MAAAIQLDPSRDETRAATHLPVRVAHKSGGGDMDDVLQRFGAIESSVSALRVEVSGIAATFPHLATKEDLKKLEAQVNRVEATIPHLATKEDLKKQEAQIHRVEATIPHLATKADLSAMESNIIKWIIATVIAATSFSSSSETIVSRSYVEAQRA